MRETRTLFALAVLLTAATAATAEPAGMTAAAIVGGHPVRSASWTERMFRAATLKGLPEDGTLLLVSIDGQRLLVTDRRGVRSSYTVSTSRYGIGSREGSNKTPLGLHRVAERIGHPMRHSSRPLATNPINT